MAKTTFNPTAVAREIAGFLQDAMADVASGMLEFPDPEDKWGPRIAAARKRRIGDLHGWLADELYNDADILSDLIGDRVCDAARGGDEAYNAVLAELARTGHTAMKKACLSLKRTPNPGEQS